jgi:hypothetical protein
MLLHMTGASPEGIEATSLSTKDLDVLAEIYIRIS